MKTWSKTSVPTSQTLRRHLHWTYRTAGFVSAICLAAIVLGQTVSGAATVGSNGYRRDSSVFIQMRDGTRLATDLYFPPGSSALRAPTILMRTPYGNVTGHSFNEQPIEVFTSHGYVVAVQDKRGKYRSEGIYTVSGGDAEDGYDTVDWISKQSWSNGRIGTFGCSYLGDTQIFLAQTKHPALKAMVPQSSGSSVGSMDGLYRYFGVRVNGAIDWAAAVGWFAGYGQKIVPKLPATLDHATYQASYAPYDQAPKPPVIDYPRAWYHLPMKDALKDQGFPPSDFEDNIVRSPTDPYWSKFPYMTDAYTSDAPALFVNGWYDFGASTTLAEFNHFRTHSVSAGAAASQYVIMGPGVHCSAERDAREKAVVGSREVGDTRFDYWGTYLDWFDWWLKESDAARKKIASWPRIRYYLMGANVWKSADGWPLPGTRKVSYYLGSDSHANSVFGKGTLTLHMPSSRGAADTFVYDPTNPVPSLGGAMCCTGTSEAVPGAEDQRRIEAREDVLVYTSEPLSAGMEVTGPVTLELFVSSTAIDTDFTAKLVDVYPDGRAFNLLESILRSRYREGQDKEVWMAPGKVYALHLDLGATSNYFGSGHRIRIEVSSSNFPRFDRNLNVGGNNAEATRWVTAINQVMHTGTYPSRLVLPAPPSR